jgi:hypothetical protein
LVSDGRRGEYRVEALGVLLIVEGVMASPLSLGGGVRCPPPVRSCGHWS